MESKESRALYQFFSRTVRPFFLLTGAGTALVGLYAFLPSWAMPNVAKLPYLQDYTIIVQHWGIMVGIMGICMMLAAIVPEWRVPILLYSAFEKAFMVWLVLGSLCSRFYRSHLHHWLFPDLWIHHSQKRKTFIFLKLLFASRSSGGATRWNGRGGGY
jgi:hypothetical protein